MLQEIGEIGEIGPVTGREVEQHEEGGLCGRTQLAWDHLNGWFLWFCFRSGTQVACKALWFLHNSALSVSVEMPAVVSRELKRLKGSHVSSSVASFCHLCQYENDTHTHIQ